ncbi:MAG TPA: alpha/beta hydrolase [Streptosporangiaceae bacterium]|nr:alpha/beta hydrolase [Streptosporangiaceae bacterium]
MEQSEPVDLFRLSYERSGAGTPVVLLHGWPGDRTDYRTLAPALAESFEVVVPDLRGFGESDKHPAEPSEQYDASAQARSVTGLIRELGLDRPILAGYDIGSRIAQAVAREAPELIRALVVAPPLPGIGSRVLEPDAQREFWYQAFHRLPLATEMLDGQPGAVREYLSHFWSHWSGPSFTLDGAALDHLVAVYGTPGAFAASIAWYRAGAGSVARSVAEEAPAPGDRIAVPTTVLWPEHDPLFPRAWADRVTEFFSDVTVRNIDGVGHFAPLEYPEDFARAIRAAAEVQTSG